MMTNRIQGCRGKLNEKTRAVLCNRCGLGWPTTDTPPHNCLARLESEDGKAAQDQLKAIDRFIILDVDGCIANDAWRIPSIDWNMPDPQRRYHKYHLLSAWDERGNVDLFVGRSEKIIVMTARPVLYRELTEEWLRRAGVKPWALLMRNNDDARASVPVKMAQLGWLEEYGVRMEQIVCAYDDRQEIIDAYRKAGLRAERRALHDVCAYVHPVTGVNHASG